MHEPNYYYEHSLGLHPTRCDVCGVELQWYGENRGIVGWHMAVAAANSYLSNKCSEYCLAELTGKQTKGE